MQMQDCDTPSFLVPGAPTLRWQQEPLPSFIAADGMAAPCTARARGGAPSGTAQA